MDEDDEYVRDPDDDELLDNPEEDSEIDLDNITLPDLSEYLNEFIKIPHRQPPAKSSILSPEEESGTSTPEGLLLNAPSVDSFAASLPGLSPRPTPRPHVSESELTPLYILIDGLSPLHLRVPPNLSDSTYQKIVKEYYRNTLFQGLPPGSLLLKKCVTFSNCSKLFVFDRVINFEETEFRTTFQELLSIYKEHPPSRFSVSLTGSETSEGESWSQFGRLLDRRGIGIGSKTETEKQFDEDERIERELSTPSHSGWVDEVAEQERREDRAREQKREQTRRSEIMIEARSLWNRNRIGTVPEVISLNRLILKWTDPPPYATEEFSRIFWWTYRTFTSPEVVLTKLIHRYYVPELKEGSRRVFLNREKLFYASLTSRIQLHVCSLMVQFLTEFYFDFTPRMVEDIKSFCQKTLQADNRRLIIQEIFQAITDARPLIEKFDSLIGQPTPLEISLETGTQTVIWNRTTFVESDFAAQLTYRTFELFKCITFLELLHIDEPNKSPNLHRYLEWAKIVRSWMIAEVLSEEDIVERKKLLEKYMKMVSQLQNLNNLHLSYAALQAVNHPSITRLQRTTAGLSAVALSPIRVIKKVFSPNQHFHTLRRRMQQTVDRGTNCCPCIDVYLEELQLIMREYPVLIEGKVNFERCVLLYKVINRILRHQGFPHPILPSPGYLRTMLSFELLDELEEFFMARSEKLEKSHRNFV